MSFTVEDIQELVSHFYGFNAKARLLSGYDDLNYLITDTDGCRFILKITEPDHSDDALKGQVAMLEHLAGTPLRDSFQRVLPVKLAGHASALLLPVAWKGRRYLIRLLSFLEGDFWYQRKMRSPELLQHLGSFLGTMDAHLAGFAHCGLHRSITWDLCHAAEAVNKVRYIKEAAHRRLADYFLLQFQTEVLPVIPSLRHAYIHNDANDYNILLQGDEVAGLIDFGDAVYSALINNLAIACTYAILYEEEPLQAASHIVSAYHASYPLRPEETDLLYYLIAARLCISVTQSAWHASEGSANEHHFLTEMPAWTLLGNWIKINPLRAKNTFRTACGFQPVIRPTRHLSDLLVQRREHIGRNLSLSYNEPLKIVQGALQYLYDEDGATWVDCVNNVSHVGHCHPTVVRAMQQQIATLNTNTRYVHDAIISYAQALTATLPSKLKVCYFVNSGSEANDLAIRMARHFTRRQDVMVLDHAYHGTSTLAIEMSPYKFDSKGGSGQKPYIHKAPSPDMYRGPYLYGDADAGRKYAASAAAILDDLERRGTPVAAFICETLLGVGGQIPLPEGYLASVYDAVRSHGAVCIADEVQVGFGRVGDAFWGFELQGVEPDIVVLGKPMGNGHPLAAVVVTEEIAAAFDNGLEYFNTFGGNPVSMVAGLAVLGVIQQEGMQEHALKTGNYLMQLLRGLMDEFRIIGDVRGHGLFIGAELVKDRDTREPAVPEAGLIVEQMKALGFLLSTDGPLNNVLKIKPPMTFDRQNAEELVMALHKVLQKIGT